MRLFQRRFLKWVNLSAAALLFFALMLPNQPLWLIATNSFLCAVNLLLAYANWERT